VGGLFERFAFNPGDDGESQLFLLSLRVRVTGAESEQQQNRDCGSHISTQINTDWANIRPCDK
jgi:hypothetical protein